MQEPKEMQVRPLGQEDPLEEGMATTAIFLPGESHGQRSLAGCSPRGLEEPDRTEVPQHTCVRVNYRLRVLARSSGGQLSSSKGARWTGRPPGEGLPEKAGL